MTILVAPDKFKGSLTTFEACDAIARGIRQVLPHAVINIFPMADGGDGFSAVMKHYLHTETLRCDAVDALGRPITADYEWQASVGTAVIEVASASGLARLRPHENDVMHASTYGTGLLIADAIQRGARTIVLGLGGSASNDAGMGILEALGFCFTDHQGAALPACGASLARVAHIAPPPVLPSISFTIACDVTNPLYGPDGAAFVYAAQKGADAHQIRLLDAGLRHYAQVLQIYTGKMPDQVPGTGAAGGIAASLMAWFPTSLQSGAELVLEASGFLPLLPVAELVITGEGRLDQQSLQGKLPGKIQALCKAHGIPVAALCGQLGLEEREWKRLGWKQVRTICPEHADPAFCMQQAAALLEQEAARLVEQWNP
jgi:glycerate kinase